MLSRALILATVMLSVLAILPAAPEALAQNLDAGKSASQIFSSTCAVCHRSQRGLLKTVQPGSLPGFLREHYTTSREMAGQLSAYLLSSGATDPRGAGGRLTKQGEQAKSGGQGEPQPAEQQGRRPRPGQPQEAARPDGDGLAPVDPRTGRPKRNRADQQPAMGPDGQPIDPAQARQKQKMGKKKGREEAPKDTSAPVEAAKPDVSKPDAPPPDAAPVEMPKPPEPAPVVIDPKIDAPKPEPVRPTESVRPNGSASETPAMRPDPVPQVTPAPKPAESETPRAAPAPSEAPAAAPAPSEPPRPTISVTPPPPPPPAPSGPPVPPISQ